MSLYEKTPSAIEDWKNIVQYTYEQFGEKQTIKYTNNLLSCIESMVCNEGFYKDINISEHKIRIKHCQKHYIFGLMSDNKPMLIIAILHENMDLMKRVKNRLNP